ncbi:hypothetical protein FUAX_45790 (plasmid) [Fulvitalea axinellae]|uniref:AB hydrolase-1 domain-containing protein n=1 Tax=Fulvitalea axinellae TaxID=1182444 RepID=A0AAU9CW43_9BACT|nr:hypothetical protein FUAX_45790 [Fulvitalea axinellae]
MKLKLSRNLLFIIAGIIASGFACCHFVLPKMIIEIDHGFIPKTEVPQSRKTALLASLKNVPTRFSVTSHDSFEIKGLISKADPVSRKGAIILAHGIRAYKEHFAPLARRANDKGFDAILIDLRAHGESQGRYCTFGFHEKKDISRVIDYLEANGHADNLGIWGQSLGGAVAMHSLAHDSRLRFGIIESSFSDFDKTVHDYFKRFSGVNVPFFADFLIKRAGDIGEFDTQNVHPHLAARSVSQPVLISHGTADGRIDIKYGRKNFQNLKSKKKRFVEVEGANHVNVWQTGGERYWAEVFGFIESSLK